MSSDDRLSLVDVDSDVDLDDPTVQRVIDLLSEVDYRRGGEWEIRLGDDSGVLFVQVRHMRPDVVTGQPGWGAGGKYRVSNYATDSEIVQATFGLFKAYEEHEVRENFYWEGKRIFGPHIDIRAMHRVADMFDARPTATQVQQNVIDVRRRTDFPL